MGRRTASFSSQPRSQTPNTSRLSFPPASWLTLAARILLGCTPRLPVAAQRLPRQQLHYRRLPLSPRRPPTIIWPTPSPSPATRSPTQRTAPERRRRRPTPLPLALRAAPQTGGPTRFGISSSPHRAASPASTPSAVISTRFSRSGRARRAASRLLLATTELSA